MNKKQALFAGTLGLAVLMAWSYVMSLIEGTSFITAFVILVIAFGIAGALVLAVLQFGKIYEKLGD